MAARVKGMGKRREGGTFRVNLTIYPRGLVEDIFGEPREIVKTSPEDLANARPKYALFDGSLEDKGIREKFNELLEVTRDDRPEGFN